MMSSTKLLEELVCSFGHFIVWTLTCRFIDGLEAKLSVSPAARERIAPRFAVDSESAAAVSDVAITPEVTKEYNAIDIAGVESIVRFRFLNSDAKSVVELWNSETVQCSYSVSLQVG